MRKLRRDNERMNEDCAKPMFCMLKWIDDLHGFMLNLISLTIRLECWHNEESLMVCGCGGIGRRARFRF